jgi:hypothetical protein
MFSKTFLPITGFLNIVIVVCPTSSGQGLGPGPTPPPPRNMGGIMHGPRTAKYPTQDPDPGGAVPPFIFSSGHTRSLHDLWETVGHQLGYIPRVLVDGNQYNNLIGQIFLIKYACLNVTSSKYSCCDVILSFGGAHAFMQP